MNFKVNIEINKKATVVTIIRIQILIKYFFSLIFKKINVFSFTNLIS